MPFYLTNKMHSCMVCRLLRDVFGNTNVDTLFHFLGVIFSSQTPGTLWAVSEKCPRYYFSEVLLE